MGVVSNVQSVVANGSFDGNFGKMFKFKYTFTDGTSLDANHKNEAAFWAVGSQIEYEITRTSPQYGNSGKVGKVQEEQFPVAQPVAQPVARTVSADNSKFSSFALAYAKDLFVPLAGQYTDLDSLSDDVIGVADKFLNYLKTR